MKKELIKYFAIYIYGMVMLFAVSKKQNTMGSTASNEFKTRTSTMSKEIKEAEKVAAQKFFSSNQKFTLQFSNNELSFLY